MAIRRDKGTRLSTTSLRFLIDEENKFNDKK